MQKKHIGYIAIAIIVLSGFITTYFYYLQYKSFFDNDNWLNSERASMMMAISMMLLNATTPILITVLLLNIRECIIRQKILIITLIIFVFSILALGTYGYLKLTNIETIETEAVHNFVLYAKLILNVLVILTILFVTLKESLLTKSNKLLIILSSILSFSLFFEFFSRTNLFDHMGFSQMYIVYTISAVINSIISTPLIIVIYALLGYIILKKDQPLITEEESI
ncbi:hypothetical protein KQ51_01234 [Candidatus Izimaplasma bacterium HR1]|uniref:hypothetical protein n=1 Tax=Candidatus Izimoplasma sp. HR1 TaxID=1541959 RepID=UPI0004F5B107|nr:hypothetical protein KQ51_01234 [Candidatus Izimaplasma bacterium HR1]